MATLERPAAETGSGSHEATGGGGGRTPDDNVRLHPFLYLYPAKHTATASLAKQLGKLAVEQQPQKKQARAYLAALDEARGAAVAAMESSLVSAEGRQQALRQYLALLQGLLGTSAAAAGTVSATLPAADAAGAQPASAEDSIDAALSAAEAGSSGSLLAGTNSMLRHAATFQWTDALLGSTTTSSSDALFELASFILASVLAAARQAANLCEDSATGVYTPASTEAYTLLRQGAGALDYLSTHIVPRLPPTTSDDLDAQVVACLSSLLLADAQSLTVLRAVAKGNQPALIASLSLDTAALFRQAADSLAHSTVASTPNSKLAHYLKYRAAMFDSYAWLWLGMDFWQSKQQAGVGLRCLQEAAVQLDVAKKAASAFDAAQPASMNLLHRWHDELLSDKLADTQRRMKREADMVYYQSVARELPPLPAPRRLVSALPFTLPPPAAQVLDGVVDCFAIPAAVAAGSGASHGAAGAPPHAAAAAAGGVQHAAATHAEQGCSCWRWVLLTVAMPLLAVISLLGCVVWVVLLPLKVICCPIGCMLQLMYNVVEGLIKMPLRWMAWAAGTPWEQAPPPQAAAPAVKH